jgi:hypothetical protein
MVSSVAPARSIDVAAEWRSRLAPRDGGSGMPARARACLTREEIAEELMKGRYGADERKNTALLSLVGRALQICLSTASPASWGSGRLTSRRPLPLTRMVPSVQQKVIQPQVKHVKTSFLTISRHRKPADALPLIPHDV